MDGGRDGRDGMGWAKRKHKGESGEFFAADDVDVLFFETLLVKRDDDGQERREMNKENTTPRITK